VRVPWIEARRAAYATARPMPPADLLLAEAGEATLAAPLRAAAPLPAFDCAAMDGYAVGDVEGPWTVVGRAIAGQAGPRDPLAPGLALEIATGAVLPPGTVAVVPYGHTTQDGDRVRGSAIAGRNVRRTGEDVPVGADLVPAGSPVTPAVVGLAAAVGLDTDRGEQDGAPPDVVGQRAEHQQGAEHRQRVDPEHHRGRDRREVPLGLVDRVQRGGGGGGGQQRHDQRGQHEDGRATGQPPAAAPA